MGVVEYLHFSLVYHGLDDRVFQEQIARIVQKSWSGSEEIARHLQGMGSGEKQTAAGRWQLTTEGHFALKLRVGFMSKFFTQEHAHGELLSVRSESVVHNVGQYRFTH